MNIKYTAYYVERMEIGEGDLTAVISQESDCHEEICERLERYFQSEGCRYFIKEGETSLFPPIDNV